jgi:hypothetical protein
MDIVDRVKKICLTPAAEWSVIEAENSSTGSLISGYVIPLAALSAAAGFIGGSLVGRTLPFIGTYRVPFATGIAMAIFIVVMAIVGVFLLSIIINALAPTFGAQQNTAQALKVAVYSYTPAWVAGVFQILPALGTLLGLIGGLYALYVLYLGLPRLMKCPQDKALGYTAVVVVCAIVITFAVSIVGGMFIGAGAMGAGMMGGGDAGSPSADVQFDPNSPMGKLQQLGESLEQSANKMEAAEKSGDAAGQVAAAMEGLGAIFGGGKRVEPIAVDQLKVFVPPTFAGLPRTDSSAEKTGIAGLMVSKAEARYGDGAGKTVTLEVVDTGGVSGLMGLASWIGVEGEKQDSSGSERTQKVGNRLVHERISKTGGDNEFGIVLGDRFLVSAKGRLDLAALKAAVSQLDLAKLEAMKGAGTQ